MPLILNNDDVEKALNVTQCLEVMEDSYREQAHSRAGVRREKPRDWTRYPEISDLIAGKAPSRANDRQITFFLNNVGTGVQFAAMGYCAYKGAKEKGLGHEIPAEWLMQDIKP